MNNINTNLFVGLTAIFLAANAGAQEVPDGESKDTVVLEELVVTGSYIKRASTIDSASPLTVVGRTQIEDIGAIDIASVVNTLPFVSGSANFATAEQGADSSTGSSNINIRNLGPGSTLVLVNGKRFVASENDRNSNNFVDTNIILPTIAIGNIEFVKDGASALYGSDAVAGVANFISRTNFEGLEFDFQVGTDIETGNGNEVRVGAIWGHQSDRGGIAVSAEYLNRSEILLLDDLDRFLSDADISRFGQPGTFRTTPSIANDSNIAFGDPDCLAAGPASRLNPNGSGACQYHFALNNSVFPDEDRLLLHIDSNYEINDNVEFYGEFSYANTNFRRSNPFFAFAGRTAPVPLANPGLQHFISRAAADPSISLGGFDPATADPLNAIFFEGRVQGGTVNTQFPGGRGDSDTVNGRDTFRAVGGFRGNLPFIGDSWTYDLSYAVSEHTDVEADLLDTITPNYLAALQGFAGFNCDRSTGTAGVGPCSYFNPFASSFIRPDGSPQTDPSLINSQETIDFVGQLRERILEQTNKTFDFVATGNVLDLPAGPLGIALGIQVRDDDTNVDFNRSLNSGVLRSTGQVLDFAGDNTTTAGFVEVAIPVTNTLEVNAALRYETFDAIEADTTDPKVSILWRPSDDLSVRGSWGTSFRAPSLEQLFAISNSSIDATDPFSGVTQFSPTQTAFNPNLQPESSENWNLGFTFAPLQGKLEGLSVSLDAYSYDFEDLIFAPSPFTLIDRDLASRCPQGVNIPGSVGFDGGRPACGTNGVTVFNDPAGGGGLTSIVVRDATGVIQVLRPQLENAQSVSTSGIDFDVRYRFDTKSSGTITTGLSGSYTNEYEITLADGTLIDGAGSRNQTNAVGRSLPDFRANATFGWSKGIHNLAIFGRYVTSYEDDTNNEQIDSHLTFDAQYRVDLSKFSENFFGVENSSLTIGCLNCTNERAPLVNFVGNFDPFVHNPVGAQVYLRYNMRY